MKKASEHLAEIRARLEAVLNDYEWGEARAYVRLHAHGASDELVEAVSQLGDHEGYIAHDDEGRSYLVAGHRRPYEPGTRSTVNAFGEHRSLAAEDDAA